MLELERHVLDTDLSVRKQTFVINDIELQIPPSAISVQKEDLAYSWRTLRTKSATKLPTGHGLISVGFSLVFTNNQLMDMHRLILEMRNSPFLYIENKFLRQTIAPEWPLGKNMAFALEGVNVSPLAGTSNCWVMQAQLCWFNYAPYGPQFWFREEWETDWLEGMGENGPIRYRNSIGWRWEDGKRTFTPSRTAMEDSSGGRQTWDALKNDQRDNSYRTVQNLESLHMGQEFDMLPLPGNMVPSQMVIRPKNSRIYTRFINLLQRDALQLNFGINLEQMMKDVGLPANGFFGVYENADGGKETWGLHTGPSERRHREVWYDLLKDVSTLMLRSNNQVNFVFQTYREIKFPTEWGKSLRDLSAATRNSYVTEETSTTGGDFLELKKYNSTGKGTPFKRVPYRKGFGSPNGFLSPVGLDGERFSMGELAKSVYGTEIVKVRSKGARGGLEDRPHYGTDFVDLTRGVGATNLDVFAARPGRVTRVVTGQSNSRQHLTWRVFDTKTGQSRELSKNPEYLANWVETTQQRLGKASVILEGDTARYTAAYAHHERAGLWYKSATFPNTFYYLDRGFAGDYVEITHDNGDFSRYMHLSDIYVNHGDVIGDGYDIDDPIGRVGQTSPFSQPFLKWVFDHKSATNGILEPFDPAWIKYEHNPRAYSKTGRAYEREDTNKGGFLRGGHLHFEYWEKEDYGNPVDMSEDGGAPKRWGKSYKTGYLPVEVLTSIRAAVDQTSSKLEVPLRSFENTEATKQSLEKKLKQNNGKDYKIDEAALESLTQTLQSLSADGWFHFEGEYRFPNIWYKTWNLSFLHSDIEDPNNINLQLFNDSNVITTGVSGGLNNILAKLPILGHEYPTVQHMGSTEPMYSFEFAAKDDQPGLDGIPRGAALMEGMRSVLQNNARSFREVKDSWAMCTDTFVTRLFGSFRDNDARFNTDGEFVNQVEVYKRTLIKRAENGTVEGNPGLSYIQMEIGETNPYYEEKLQSQASPFVDVELAVKEVLNALYHMRFAEKYAEAALPILVGNLAGYSFDNLDEEAFGQFKIIQVDDSAIYGIGNLAQHKIYYVSHEYAQDNLGLDRGGYLIHDPTGAYERLLIGQSTDDLDIYNLQRLKDQEEALFITGPAATDLDGYDVHAKDFHPTLPGYDWRGDPQVPYYEGYAPSRNKVVRRSYDISRLLETSDVSRALTEINLPKIADYWALVDGLVETASVLLSESADLASNPQAYNKGGLRGDETKELFYDLPVKPRMWRTFQYYQLIAARHFATWPDWKRPGLRPGARDLIAESLLTTNPGWIQWNEVLNQSELRPRTGYLNMTSLAHSLGMGSFETLNGYAGGAVLELYGDAFMSLYRKITDQDFTSESEGITGTAGLDYSIREQIKNIEGRLIDNFFTSHVPLKGEHLREIAKFYARESLLGPLISAGSSGDGASPVSTAYGQLYDALHSTGYWGFGMGDSPLEQAILAGKPAFLLPSEEALSTVNSGGNGTTFVNSKIIGDQPRSLGRVHALQTPIFLVKTESLGDLKRQYVDPLLKPYTVASDALADRYGVEREVDDSTAFIGNGGGEPISGTTRWNSTMEYEVSRDVELQKAKYFREKLAGLAKDMLRDIRILRAFGLEDYGYVLSNQQNHHGTEAYGDLDLPEHPYYGDSRQVTPDFYMWNIYEDGQAFGPDILADMRVAAGAVVQNCYDSMKRLQSGETYNAATDEQINQGVTEVQDLDVTLRYNAEATDGNNENPNSRGHSAVPWYPDSASADDVAVFSGTATEAQLKAHQASNEVSASSIQALEVDVDSILAPNPPAARLDALEGMYGQDGGLHYPMRTTPEKYKKLKETLESANSMFGSRAGHLEKNQPDELEFVDRLKGTQAARPDEFAHLFDAESLKALANDSCKDILSQKMTLRRAFPTFKLYFVEEDEIENHLLSYDDFYSYNGVKEFTFVDSRKMAASTAVITLQNIAGTLDGTRRDAIADLDYFNKSIEKKVPENASIYSGDAIADGTDLEQPFDSVVLRPGVNVQLRVGYSNDPRNLSVLLSGRVVDLTWNKSGDMAEITVQSFGAELVQVLKGINRGSAGTLYQTTHHLLGGMMLSPELVHFGRWEHGAIYQLGESTDARLDFRDYSREGFLGRFRTTIGVTDWLFESPGLLLAGSIGLTAASFFPATRLFKKVGGDGWVGKLLTGLSKASTIGQGGGNRAAGLNAVRGLGSAGTWEKFIRRVAGDALERGGWRGLSPGQRLRIMAAVLRRNRDVYRTTIRNADKLSDDALKLAQSQILSLSKLINIGKKFDTVEDVAGELAGAGSRVRNVVFSGQWLNKPVAELSFESVASFLSVDSVKRLGGNLLTAMGPTSTKIILGASTGGLVVDLLRETILEDAWDYTFGRLAKFFETTKVSMFLTPQDDNIFAPHPKDYMKLDDNSWWTDLKAIAARQVLASAFSMPTIGDAAQRWIRSEHHFDKRVEPTSCGYTLVSTTIWDVFHEMSLRHPGWIYAARPYGTDFRYTMFFGVPSQRYWARGASEEFILRANKLARHLEDRELNENEFRDLYGNTLNGVPLEQAKLDMKEAIIVAAKVDTASTGIEAQDLADGPEFETAWKQALTGPAMLEYLRALELRFIPFRRHHLISSSTDLVWNGIMNSENAVHNAVNVTYFNVNDEAAALETAVASNSVFKAHSFIPQHMIRMLSLPVYRNCKGPEMAARYGMGSLLHTMRDMYRGEVIIVGNARIRPWDIAILTDDYNDMVGPIEVEQVVHTFSHQTGFITEVKPSAFVVGNEISSWPLVEAAKIFSLAVRDVESNYWGQGAQLGSFEQFLEFVDSNLGDSDREAILEKYDRMFGDEIPVIQDLQNNKDLVDSLSAMDDSVQQVVNGLKFAGMGMLQGAGVVGGLLAGGMIVGAGGVTGLIAKTAMTGGTFAKAGAVGSVLGGLGATAGGAVIGNTVLNAPSMKMLLGGSVLFLQCMREESIMVVPLIKHGHPIVSGLNTQDPAMILTHFRGNLRRMVEDTFEGTEEMFELWNEYSTGSWQKIADSWDASSSNSTGLTRQQLTGGTP